jgi:hypothetical protein
METMRAVAVRGLRETAAAELAGRRAELQQAAEAAGLTPREVEEILNARPDLPRPLLPEERATLLAVLHRADFPDRDALVAQTDAARVTGYCGCGCASVDLAVDRSAPAAAAAPSPVPNDVTLLDADGEPIGGVLVFLTDGYLSLLEVYDYGVPISPLPSPAAHAAPA